MSTHEAPETTTRNVTYGDIQVTHGDNFAWVPDKSVDLILTDPPFNIAQDTNFHTWGENSIHSYRFDDGKDWDTYEDTEFVALINKWAGEFSRVLRPGGSFAIFCADTYISHFITALENAKLHPRRVVTWRKPNAVPVNRKRMPMSSCEYIITGIKNPGPKATFQADIHLSDINSAERLLPILLADKAAAAVEKAVRVAITTAQTAATQPLTASEYTRIAAAAATSAGTELTKRVGDIFVNDAGTEYARACVPNYITLPSRSGSGRIHPTEKPVPLLEYFIALLSLPGDTILDPFAGSGSLGEAAHNSGRKAILVERDSEFFGKLSTRIDNLTRSH